MTAKKSCLSVVLFNNLLIMQKQHETVTHTELRTEILDNLIPVSLCKFVFDCLLLVDNSLYYIQTNLVGEYFCSQHDSRNRINIKTTHRRSYLVFVAFDTRMSKHNMFLIKCI